MKDDKFNEYTKRCLELARDGGWTKSINAEEELAWEIHAEFPPTGSLLLGHLLLEQKDSYIKPDLEARDFARALLAKATEEVQAIEHKDGWDHYYLGMAHAYGLGVSRNYAKAAEAFAASHEAGNPYARFEAIWARYIAGGSRLEAALDLQGLKGALADFAAFSARALVLLETGPAREPASHAHIVRLLLLRRALHEFIYHEHGAKQINIAIEKELRAGVPELLQLDTSRGYLALYLTAKASRVNPTGKPPLEWFCSAVDPEIEELEILCRRRELGREELRIIVQQAQREAWQDSRLASLAASELASLDE